MEFDHLFVCVSAGAPEAERLVEAGFHEGQPNVHPGQGTACRRFFFENAYLELFWVSDETEARGEMVTPMRLWERWRYRDTGASPFGICLRPVAGGAPDTTPPFATWAYRPPYLPESVHIDVARTSDRAADPLLFALQVATRPDRYPADRSQPLDHECGASELTGVRISLPADETPPELAAVERLGIVTFARGHEHLAEVGFDGGGGGRVLDCRPDMPLVLRW